MKTFIMHANQEVFVSSKHGWWAPETLRSKPTFSIKARDLEAAKRIAEKEVREKYEDEDVHVESINLSFPLVREVSA